VPQKMTRMRAVNMENGVLAEERASASIQQEA
jgi:hypothetical protein